MANANKINKTVFLTKSDPVALNAMPVTELSHSETIEKFTISNNCYKLFHVNRQISVLRV